MSVYVLRAPSQGDSEAKTNDDLQRTDDRRVDHLDHPEIAVVGEEEDDEEDSQR